MTHQIHGKDVAAFGTTVASVHTWWLDAFIGIQH